MSVFGSNASALDNTGHVLGANLEGITDYTGDWLFLNRMKSTRKWTTFEFISSSHYTPHILLM